MRTGTKLFLRALVRGAITVSVVAVIGAVVYLVLLGRALHEWGRPRPSPVKCTTCYALPEDPNASMSAGTSNTDTDAGNALLDVIRAVDKFNTDDGGYPPGATQVAPGQSLTFLRDGHAYGAPLYFDPNITLKYRYVAAVGGVPGPGSFVVCSHYEPDGRWYFFDSSKKSIVFGSRVSCDG